MTRDEWIKYFENNFEEHIKPLIRRFHPHHKQFFGEDYQADYAKITAKRAEKFSEFIRKEIEKEPRKNIFKAIDEKDCETLMSILNQTWFGIPESRPLVNSLGRSFDILCTLCEGWEE